ncbi:MAG: histidine kinase dimerization/phospho-acceptor domain-containing protein, partial [Candidatus Geothermincolales bacterium]
MRQRLIREVASSVVSAGGERSILEGLLRSMVRGTEAAGGALFTSDADEGKLRPIISSGIPLNLLDPAQLLQPQVMDQVLQGKTIYIWETRSDPRIKSEKVKEVATSVLFLPLRANSGNRGLILLTYRGKRTFSAEDLDFLDALAELGGNILERAAQEARLLREAREAQKDLDRIRQERRQFLDFLSTVAHDLKSPLAAEQFFLKMLLRKASDRLEPKLVDGIKRSIRRLDMMMDMITSLLDLSRLESGQVLEEFRPVWLEEVLGAAL